MVIQRTLLGNLLACAILFSCAKEMPLPEQPVLEDGTYTLTVEAEKAERPDTKALMYDELADKLEARWVIGEEVKVYKGEALLGTLTAQSAGASTTLKGTVSGSISVGDVLVLKFLKAEYDTQDGTLTGRPTSIDKTCDHAIAEVTVQSVTGSGITTSEALFKNQQAIVLFILRNEEDTDKVKALNLLITAGDRTITINPTIALPRFYVAIPALSSSPLLMRAKAGNKVYMLYKESVTLEAGKYYEVTARLSEATLVHDETELRAAVQTNNVKILFANDISTTSLLEIKNNRTVTIDMDGYTLDRGCTSRGTQAIVVRTGSALNLNNGTVTGGWGGNGGALDIEDGTTVNLTNVTITGNHADDRGGGISIRSGGTLNMTGGAITGNSSNDKNGEKLGGGGLFNYDGATATLTNVTITGNEAKVKGGGGICNYGTMTMDGCTIQDNIARMNGGGIWNGKDATLSINGGNISGNTAGEQGGGIYTHSNFSMQGAVNITDNKRKDAVNNNVYLTPDAVITVTGSLENSSIGLTMENATGTFTSGYNTYNSGVNPATIFTPDLTGVMAVSPDDNNEAQLSNSLPDGDIYYIERSWDDVGKCVKAEIKKLREGDYIVLNGSDDDLIISQGTFVVKGDVSYDHIYTVDGGEHNIILCDGAKLSADFLRVEDDNEVYIYGQANNTGQLVITEEALAHHAGIGSDDSKTVGTIVIHGGDINTKASNSSAGIGGGRYSPGGTVIIYGGKVYAEGNASVTGTSTDSNTAGSGIGGGFAGNGGDLTVYGGNINAEGGSSGAGIGSGRRSGVEDKPNVYGGNVTVYGGTVIAHGSVNGGAGIGGGTDGNGATVTIHGGTVKAWGRGNGAGIGTGHNTGYNGVYIDFTGKLTVTGGEVYAYGHDDEVIGGAGIGGGKDANGSEVIITGGYVYAEGGRYSAGIGSGCEALFSGGVQGGSLTVTGGRVEAYGGEDAAGIGGGEDADGGTVTISGGYVYAKGSYGGAGIGGGEGGDGANVSITGGTVHASAGSGDTGNRAIGPGYGSDAYGKLTLGDLLMVRAERMADADERVPMCWYRTDVHVEPCTHPGYTAETCPYHKHD